MKVAHLGINAANAENAAQIAELFHVLFGFEPKCGNSSIFVGDKMIDESSAKYKNGELTAIYFQNEIAGFAIHLLKN